MATATSSINTINRVKIHEVTKITPMMIPDDDDDLICLPLTLFDTYWLKFLPVERLFFYEVADLTWDLFDSEILPKLKHSLSLTLGIHYLPLAGHMVWPEHAAKPAIYYFLPGQDQKEDIVNGVTVAVAESEGLDFDVLSGDGIRQAVEFRALTPQLSISDNKAEVVSIQITLFPKQGFCIGISNHHAFFDGRSTMMFIKSWAYLCKQYLDIASSQQQQQQQQTTICLPSELIPSFDRAFINENDPKGFDLVYVNNWLSFTGNDRSLKVLPSFNDVNKLVRATYVLTRAHLKKLRDKLLLLEDRNRQTSPNKLHLSTFVLACAYVFTCMVKARGGGESDRDVILAFTADYRSRLDPPVPTNYFGNCVGSHTRLVKARDFVEEPAATGLGGVAFVAHKLSEMVQEIGGGLTIQGFDEEKLVKLMAVMQRVSQGGQGLGVAGSIHFDVYGSDFGWGRPKKVEIVSIDTTGAVSLAESRHGDGGVEVGLALGKQDMDNFASFFDQGLKDLIV
ncbi:hypothetical protein WN943_005671 [Citrus x changshan-huyou]|uniref:malonyl-CoA:anthocyanidin 5-O-glucoside-6''-O-malonyltransferase n=1 Tax=Citrus sinensis TaxID=2711 RepID=UPI0003D6FD4F|nr:malonyl-CoA:anthocyanidin 5-O-glucoside-6''-O-malonyltransferase [Citrus sinensis]